MCRFKYNYILGAAFIQIKEKKFDYSLNVNVLTTLRTKYLSSMQVKLNQGNNHVLLCVWT
jgi:hypothetical protein